MCGCADKNECMYKNGGCSANALCTNTVGSYSCKCKPGYNGNGKMCNRPRGARYCMHYMHTVHSYALHTSIYIQYMAIVGAGYVAVAWRLLTDLSYAVPVSR